MSLNERQISDREIKALQIAAKTQLKRKGNVWFVPSQAGQGEYEVRPIHKRRDAPVPITNSETHDASISLQSNTF